MVVVEVPITIGSNIASLQAQRRLGRASDELSSSFERLSSGQRINKASDDAAGLSIADTLTAKTRIYSQGLRNINDGLSLTNIAEGAISALSDIVTRQKELAEQAANGTYSTKQRVALNNESRALTKEYNRIIQSTTFNGLQVLDGRNASVTIQHGVGVDESTTIKIGQALGVAAGNGSFTAQASHDPGQTGNQVYSITAGDFNGDGLSDFLSSTGTEHSVHLSNGDGTFRSGQSFAIQFPGHHAATADFNGDGITDLALVGGSNSNDDVDIRLGNGDGTFGSASRFTALYQPLFVATGDFNNDGRSDFITADNDSKVTIRLGNGDGTFGSRITYAQENTFNTASLALGDFNGDGILDFATGDSGSGRISTRLGNGDGTFGNVTTYATSGASNYLLSADFNADGITDLLSANTGPNHVEIRLGQSNGTFGSVISYAATLNGTYAAADLNGDGNLDIVANAYSTFASNNTLRVRYGNGNGTFGAQVTFSVTGTREGLAAGDFNGDGVTDLVTGGNQPYADVIFGNVDPTGRRNNLVSPLDLTTVSGAKAALSKTTTLLDTIARELGNIGAIQSRLHISAQNLAVRSENYAAARSRIVDVDIAQEGAELVRGRILQQAGASVLAQANLQPQIALQLLR